MYTNVGLHLQNLYLFQYMHCKKILHRDLKPQNIFLKDKFNIKIGDLGIARWAACVCVCMRAFVLA